MHRGILLSGIASFVFASSLSAQVAPDSGSNLALGHQNIFNNIDSYALIEELPLPIQLSTLFPADSLSLGDIKKVSAAPRRQSEAKDSKDFEDSKDVSAHVLIPSDPLYYGGEIGAFYGHATGKFGGDAFGGYAIGTVGNDKVQITVGTSYEEFDGRDVRLRSFRPH